MAGFEVITEALQDIRYTRNIEAVFTTGTYHSREDLDTMLQRAERKSRPPSR